MKYLAFVTLLATFALNSCATMSAEEKSQWLEQYRKIAAERTQRDFDAPHGEKDQYRQHIQNDRNSPRAKKALENIYFKEKTGHGLDTLEKLLVDADVRAMDKTYDGQQVRYWVDFYNSEDGKLMLKKRDEIHRQRDAELAANPGKDPEAIVKRHNARFTKASEEIAHNFEAGVGRALLKKQDQYLGTRYRYEQEARALYQKKIAAAIYAYNQKNKKARAAKAKASGKAKTSH